MGDGFEKTPLKLNFDFPKFAWSFTITSDAGLCLHADELDVMPWD